MFDVSTIFILSTYRIYLLEEESTCVDFMFIETKVEGKHESIYAPTHIAQSNIHLCFFPFCYLRRLSVGEKFL